MVCKKMVSCPGRVMFLCPVSGSVHVLSEDVFMFCQRMFLCPVSGSVLVLSEGSCCPDRGCFHVLSEDIFMSR